MGKKSRRIREKKAKEYKTREERKREMEKIKEQLTSLGLVESMEGVDEFYRKAEGFVERSECWTGKIKIPGSKRILSVILTADKKKECISALLYDKNI